MKISTFIFVLIAVFVCLFSFNASAQIRGWGANGYGQLGIGNITEFQPNPQTVSTVPDATAISSGYRFTLFLKANGTIVASGWNAFGELGDGTTIMRSTPIAVLNLTNVAAISGGFGHSLALKLDGTVWAWGHNTSGQIGDGTTVQRLSPVQVGGGVSGFNNIIAIHASDRNSIALKADGTVWVWGDNQFGQLGDGTTAARNLPVQITTLLNVIAVQGGKFHSLALKSDGTVWAWGYNAQGQLGNGSTTTNPVLIPTQITTLTGVSQIAAGDNHNAALKPNGTVYTWGNNEYGQSGNGTSSYSVPTPTQINISDVIDIKGGGEHTLARKRDGKVWGWGSNGYGELGNGSINSGPPYSPLFPVQSNVGTGNAFIGAGGYIHSHSGIPFVATPAGSNVRFYGENLNISFASVTATGTTTYSAVDPNAYTPPAGFDIVDNSPAFNLTTTAAFTLATVCLKVATEYSLTRFNALYVLPQEDGSFINRTVSRDYQRREICAAVTNFSPIVLAQRRAAVASAFDFDGDGKADQAVFRPFDRVWYLLRSSQGFTAAQFGTSTDKITPADFDGDGRTDIAVFRDNTWYWLNSSNSIFNAVQFGQAGDVPVPADYSGDGRVELAVYRSGVWYALNLANNQFQAVQFGTAGDKPIPADFDADGKIDFAVYRDGVWYLLQSSGGFITIQFGNATDIPTIGDYDGDGKVDQAVYRSGVWYILGSTQGFYATQFGVATDIPVAADYDGDGKTDIAVFREGVWYLLRSQQGYTVVQFGVTNDRPIPSAFVPY